jgi:acyl-CoA synthetase (AMP-forming)/AMP-acid ligase II
MLTHQNLVYSARYAVRHLRNSSEDRLLALMPFSFSYGLMQLTTMFLAGGSCIIQRAPLTADILEALASKRITGLAGTPVTWIALTEELSARPRQFPALRYITSSGAPVPTPVLDALPRVLPGVDIHLLYGTTEGLRATSLPPGEYLAKKGSLGKAIPGVEVFVVAEEAGICGPGEEGELVYRSNAVCVGYWGKPEETAKTIKACPQLEHLLGNEKVLYSGDTVRIDEEGFLWFVGRKDFLIQVGGSRVSPTEVEDSVYQSALIKNVIAFGVADERQGQVVHVAVSLPDGSSVDEQALMRHCRKNMAPHMVPAVIHLWEGDLPSNGRGKLDRARIVETYTAQGSLQ